MKSKLLILLLFALCSACEQERIDDNRTLHPYTGDEPVLFAFLQNGATTVAVEAQQTLPYYSDAANAFLADLTGSLQRGDADLGTLLSGEPGFYTAQLTESITSGVDYHLQCEHPALGRFRTAAVQIPAPLRITGIDTIRQNGDLELSGNFSAPSSNVSVSSKILRYGEGELLNNNSSLLPVREAHQPGEGGSFSTETYLIRDRFVVFDPELLIPVDTVRVDSVRLILYTWSEEVLRFNRALTVTNQEVGDGGEAIDGTSWSNVEGGHGLVAGFAGDTVTVRLR